MGAVGQRRSITYIHNWLVTSALILRERTVFWRHGCCHQNNPRSRGMGPGLAKLHRYHANIQQECGIIVKTIKAEMKSDLIPLAEEKSNHGKVLKAGIRELWSLEYEIEEIQTEFVKGIGSINIAELTDDFVEDVMLQSKPLQGILMAIRLRQKDTMEVVKAKYGEVIGALEPLTVKRPPKPVAAPAAPVAAAPEAAVEAPPAAAPAPVEAAS